MMKNVTLIMFTGLPGSGKTTLAQRVAKSLCIPLFSKDFLQSTLRRMKLADRNTVHGYHLLLDLADEQLKIGVSVVLDAVFPLEEFRMAARNIADQNKAKFCVVHCYCSNDKTWQERMSGRHRYVPNWTPVDWAEVERLRQVYQLWNSQEALFVDALDNLDKNLSLTLQWIQEVSA